MRCSSSRCRPSRTSVDLFVERETMPDLLSHDTTFRITYTYFPETSDWFNPASGEGCPGSEAWADVEEIAIVPEEGGLAPLSPSLPLYNRVFVYFYDDILANHEE